MSSYFLEVLRYKLVVRKKERKGEEKLSVCDKDATRTIAFFFCFQRRTLCTLSPYHAEGTHNTPGNPTHHQTTPLLTYTHKRTCVHNCQRSMKNLSQYERSLFSMAISYTSVCPKLPFSSRDVALCRRQIGSL